MRTHFDLDHDMRSWRTIQSIRRNTAPDFDNVGRQSLVDSLGGFDRNDRRQNSGEESMQRATTVDMIAARITMMIGAALVITVHVLIMHVVVGRIGKGLRACQRRGHNAGELRNEEQRDEDADKAGYRPEPLHQPFMHQCSAAIATTVCGGWGLRSIPAGGKCGERDHKSVQEPSRMASTASTWRASALRTPENICEFRDFAALLGLVAGRYRVFDAMRDVIGEDLLLGPA
jgi:hypothetical protein